MEIKEAIGRKVILPNSQGEFILEGIIEKSVEHRDRMVVGVRWITEENPKSYGVILYTEYPFEEEWIGLSPFTFTESFKGFIQ